LTNTAADAGGTSAGVAACAAGKIELVVREYTSTNTATVDLKKATNCYVCVDASSCDTLASVANIELETNTYATGASATSWLFD